MSKIDYDAGDGDKEARHRPSSVERRVWNVHRRNDVWIGEMTQWDYATWVRNMRMSRVCFVVQKLMPLLTKKSTQLRKTIPVSKRVMIAVYRLATTCEFRTISSGKKWMSLQTCADSGSLAHRMRPLVLSHIAKPTRTVRVH